jgi:hypothetical protein
MRGAAHWSDRLEREADLPAFTRRQKNWRSSPCPGDDLSPSSEQNGRDSKDVQPYYKQSRYREPVRISNRS